MFPVYVTKLMQCFNKSFINAHGEFIAHEKANEYFKLVECKDEIEVKCKVLEWFSRGAYKTQPFGSTKKNQEFNKFMLCGINQFLDTKFTEEDMVYVYTKLGNRVNHDLTIKFIESGYDMAVII